MTSLRTRYGVVGVLLVAILTFAAAAAAHPGHQHGPLTGHLLGNGVYGNIEFVSKLRMHDAQPDTIADVAVFKNYAYLAKWGATDCGGPETGGQGSPDGGAYVIDISDLSNPKEVGFIATNQDTLVGEGMQGLTLSTSAFSGDVLLMNHEGCGKNFKGGFSIWDISNPLKPKKLSEHFGDTTINGGKATPQDVNTYHSVFGWTSADGKRAFLVATDNEEGSDVDIYEITNPKKPVQLTELDLNDFDVMQPSLGLTDSFLHDMVVKRIGNRDIMLLSYWDGGYVTLDVSNPAAPVFLSDTDYPAIDPELLESADISLPPEGNGHQGEFTLDSQFAITTDEDFGPYRTTPFKIPSLQREYGTASTGGGAPVTILPDQTLNGPVVYGGYGCPVGSEPIPPASSIDWAALGLTFLEEKIVVLQRGPEGDPSATEEACFPGEKAAMAKAAGYDAVVLVSRHVAGGAAADVAACGSGAFPAEPVVAVCTTHTAYHDMFNSTPAFDIPYVASKEPTIGQIGRRIEVGSLFDGWGYVHLWQVEGQGQSLTSLDTYAINEAHLPAFATGFGDLSVHEVATDRQDSRYAYLSYYAGGIRSLEIQGTELVEVGGYLDPLGNDFWGIETFARNGVSYVIGSDMDYGIFIVKRKQ